MSDKPVRYFVKAFAVDDRGATIGTVLMTPPIETEIGALDYAKWLESPVGMKLRHITESYMFGKFELTAYVPFRIVETTIY